VHSVFEVAAGSVIGRDHAAAGRNNQDAFCWLSTAAATLAVVCDGCGSGRYSEVGARLGARLSVEALRRHVPRLGHQSPGVVLEAVRLELLAELGQLAKGMGGGLSQAVADYLLFTIVGAVVTESAAVVFSLGDGVAVVNGVPEVLESPDNEPPYLAYALSGMPPSARSREELCFRALRVLPAADVDAIVIGSDGVGDLLRVAERLLPGRSEPAGPIRQFWDDDRYFRNPAGLGRRLAQLNRPASRIDWERRRVEREHGLLPDDTTLVVVRRRARALDAERAAGPEAQP
jgi:hypothetical protein